MIKLFLIRFARLLKPIIPSFLRIFLPRILKLNKVFDGMYSSLKDTTESSYNNTDLLFKVVK